MLSQLQSRNINPFSSLNSIRSFIPIIGKQYAITNRGYRRYRSVLSANTALHHVHINKNNIPNNNWGRDLSYPSVYQVKFTSLIQNRHIHSGRFLNNSIPQQHKKVSDTTSSKHLFRDNTLNAETPKVRQSIFQRLKSNLKWILIRNKDRPFSKDELGTLFSWLIISQIVWIILKTTTFVSLLLLAVNTVFAKELVGETIGKLLNHFIRDIDIKFQDALIPEWGNGLIKFNNVELKTSDNQADNYFAFDLTFRQIEMNLSLKKWISGRGLINDIKIQGMNGTTDIIYIQRTKKLEAKPHTNSTQESNLPAEETVGLSEDLLQPKNDNLLINWFSNSHYQLNNIVISDSRITVNESFRNGDPSVSYHISLFNLEIPKLRFNQMITDFLNATVISGSINNSLFTFHKRQQKVGFVGSTNDSPNNSDKWQRITRLRLNSINVKVLGLSPNKSFNWIEDGTVNIIADIMLPFENESENSVTGSNSKDTTIGEDEEDKYVVVDLRFVFKDLKAVLPTEPPKLSSGENIVSLNELKPIVSYVNLQRVLTQFQKLSGNDDDKITAHTILFRDTPGISIRRRKSYPNISTISKYSDSNKTRSQYEQKVKDSQAATISDNKEESTSSVTTESPSLNVDAYNPNVPITNELRLRARLVRNVKDLENKILFQETGVYDQLSMELYIDLMKIVEEWEYKNKDEWLKRWGNGLASQLLLFGFTSTA